MLIPTDSLIPDDIDHQEKTVRGNDGGKRPEKTGFLAKAQMMYRESREDHIPRGFCRFHVSEQVGAVQFDAFDTEKNLRSFPEGRFRQINSLIRSGWILSQDRGDTPGIPAS